MFSKDLGSSFEDHDCSETIVEGSAAIRGLGSRGFLLSLKQQAGPWLDYGVLLADIPYMHIVRMYPLAFLTELVCRSLQRGWITRYPTTDYQNHHFCRFVI